MNKWRSDKGFSLIETMITMAIFGTVSAMAVFQIGIARPGFKGDGAMRMVMGQLNIAKEQAITQRRNMQIAFTVNNEVQISRENVPGHPDGALTPISKVPMEGGVHYGLTPDLPDTEGVPSPAAAIDFGAAIQPYKFTSEGTLVDSANNPISGTVYMAFPGDKRGARAVTILGATGRVRGFKWDGRNWKKV